MIAPAQKPHILVIDDDDRLRALLSKFLHDQGYMVSAAERVSRARKLMDWFAFDLLVLDVMMPGESGLAMLASMPQETRPPVLMLSAMGEAPDRIKGLEVGAEDYLSKPFEPKELVLRIQTILRRNTQQKKDTVSVHFGEYAFDLETNQLTKDKEIVHLTTAEATLLRLLARHSGKPISREELAQQMGSGSSERSVDVLMTRLRKKIESSGKPAYLQTVRGAGYVLQATRGGL